MRRVVILRHGRAEEFAVGGDRERQLVPAGVEEGVQAGKAMVAMKVIDPSQALIITSSTVQRAKDTAKAVAQGIGAAETTHDEDGTIYQGGTSNYLEVIAGLEDSAEQAIIIGHNPEISGFALTYAERRGVLDTAQWIGFVDENASTWEKFSMKRAKAVW